MIKSTFTENLKTLRKEAGLTQKQLAEELHSTDKNIWAYEKGNVMPPVEILITYANYFNVTTDYLLGLEDDFGMPTVAPMGDSYTTEERKIVNQYRQLPDKLKDIIKSQLDVFSGEDEKIKKNLK